MDHLVELQVEKLNFKLQKLNLSGVARGDPPQTPIKSIEAELDFNSAEMDLTEVARGGLELKLHEMYLFSSECNFSAMLTSWEASTPRRSRGVLVLPTSQHCSGVNADSPSATSVQC